MSCKNCGFYYQTEDERFPSCHCEDSCAPCEYDDGDWDCDGDYYGDRL